MKIYWHLNSIPGMEDLDKQERMLIWRSTSFSLWKSWRAYLVMCAGILFALLLTLLLPSSLAPFSTGIGAGLAVFILGQLTSRKCVFEVEKYKNQKKHWSPLPISSRSEQGAAEQPATVDESK